MLKGSTFINMWTHKNSLPNLFTIEKSSGLGLAPLGDSTISRDISLQEASVLRQESRLRAASCLEMVLHDGPEGSTSDGLRMVPAGSAPNEHTVCRYTKSS